MDVKVRVEHLTGKAYEAGAEDGVVSSERFHSPHGMAKFHSPHGMANTGSALFICDSGNKSFILSQTQNPCKSCCHLCIHTLRCLKLTTIEEGDDFHFPNQCR